MPEVHVTMLLDGNMKQLGIVRESAQEIREILVEAAREESGNGAIWLKLTGANGCEFHISSSVWSEIACINEVIVVDQQEKETGSKVIVPQPPFGS